MRCTLKLSAHAGRRYGDVKANRRGSGLNTGLAEKARPHPEGDR